MNNCSFSYAFDARDFLLPACMQCLHNQNRHIYGNGLH